MFSRAYKTAVTLPPLVWVTVFLLVPYLLMFCYSFWSVSASQTIVHSWNLDNYRQLLQGRRLLADFAALDVDCRAGDDFLAAARISAGVFSFLLRGKKKDLLYQIGDHSAVGQLSGAGLCVENNSRIGWRAEYSAAVCASDQASAGVLAVQPVCRGADADAHLHAVCVSCRFMRRWSIFRAIWWRRRTIWAQLPGRHSGK